VDTVTFNDIVWNKLSVRGIANFSGEEDTVKLFKVQNYLGAEEKLFMVSEADYENFWSNPVWQLGIDFKDRYNNQTVDLYAIIHPKHLKDSDSTRHEIKTSLIKTGLISNQQIGICTSCKELQELSYIREMEVYKQTESSKLFVPNQKKEEKFANETKVWRGQEINVFPNPASSYIEIECFQFDGKSAELIVFNISTGQEIIRQKISTKEKTKLDISGLAKGTYQLSVLQSNKNQAYKFICLNN